MTFPAPSTSEERLAVGSLPERPLGCELAGEEHSAPALWHRALLTWRPFVASLWGRHMERLAYRPIGASLVARGTAWSGAPCCMTAAVHRKAERKRKVCWEARYSAREAV